MHIRCNSVCTVNSVFLHSSTLDYSLMFYCFDFSNSRSFWDIGRYFFFPRVFMGLERVKSDFFFYFLSPFSEREKAIMQTRTVLIDFNCLSFFFYVVFPGSAILVLNAQDGCFDIVMINKIKNYYQNIILS